MVAAFSSIFETEQYLFFDSATASSAALAETAPAYVVPELDMGEDAGSFRCLFGNRGNRQRGERFPFLAQDGNHIHRGAAA